MSERLQGVKNVLHMNTYMKRPLMIPFDPDDVDWLIEQAEQTESFKKLHKTYLDRYVDSVGEINRLREALAFYANADKYYEKPMGHGFLPSEISEDDGETARKALEETK